MSVLSSIISEDVETSFVEAFYASDRLIFGVNVNMFMSVLSSIVFGDEETNFVKNETSSMGKNCKYL